MKLLLIDTITRQVRRVVDKTVGPWYSYEPGLKNLPAAMENFRALGDVQKQQPPIPVDPATLV